MNREKLFSEMLSAIRSSINPEWPLMELSIVFIFLAISSSKLCMSPAKFMKLVLDISQSPLSDVNQTPTNIIN